MGWLKKLETKADDFTPIGVRFEDVTLPLSTFHFAPAVRYGLDSNVVMAPVHWVMRTLPEADLVVERRMGMKPWGHVEDHLLEERLQAPNEGYDGSVLLQATVLSYVMDGNAYWLKRRNRFGDVVELWYVPHWLVEPEFPRDGTAYITRYKYMPDGGGEPQYIRIADVVHLRFGLDPRNTRKGLSPLKSLMREVYTDEEAANFSAMILKNMGVPGLLVAPKEGGTSASPGDVDEIKRYLDSSHTGDRRGGAMVMSAPTEVHQFGFDPNRLRLEGLRDITEERVCAVLGIPAAVVGFGSGLQSTKVGATMRELRRMAEVQCIIPMQVSIARQVTRQLMPDFEALPRRWRVRFDRSGVSAFQEDETEKAGRIVKLVLGGLLRVDKGQEMVGLEVDPSQAVYLRPSSAIVVPVSDEGIHAAPVPPMPDVEESDDVNQVLAAMLARAGRNGPSLMREE